MNPFISNPTQLLKNLGPIRALGADAQSRRCLASHMFQANLKRAHHGWSAMMNRMCGTTAVSVQLQSPARMPFSYRPGTTDLLVLEQVLLDREYDVEPIAPRSIEYLVDLGSNIGVTAMLWAQRFPDARLVLVEPDPDNFKLLEQNTATFRDRCLLLNAAVSDRCGKTRFFRSDREYGHSILKTGDCVSEIQVETLTVPAVLEKARFPRVDFLKMDIEGGERVVMPTIESWPMIPRYLIAELHPPYDFEAFQKHCNLVGLQAMPPFSDGFECNLPLAVRR